MSIEKWPSNTKLIKSRAIKSLVVSFRRRRRWRKLSYRLMGGLWKLNKAASGLVNCSRWQDLVIKAKNQDRWDTLLWHWKESDETWGAVAYRVKESEKTNLVREMAFAWTDFREDEIQARVFNKPGLLGYFFSSYGYW